MQILTKIAVVHKKAKKNVVQDMNVFGTQDSEVPPVNAVLWELPFVPPLKKIVAYHKKVKINVVQATNVSGTANSKVPQANAKRKPFAQPITKFVELKLKVVLHVAKDTLVIPNLIDSAQQDLA